MKVTTKKGDSGYTLLLDNKLSKASTRVKLLGFLDEAIAALAVAEAETGLRELEGLEDMLSALAVEVSGGEKSSPAVLKRLDEIADKGIEDELHRFVRPYGKAAYIHLARTKVRQAESLAVELKEEEEREEGTSKHANPTLIKALNRMSDVIFIYAYKVQKERGEMRFF